MNTDEDAFDRRVYAREFRQAIGCGTTWFREMEQQGVIPAGHVDPGGRRKWWHKSEVLAALERMKATASSHVAVQAKPKAKRSRAGDIIRDRYARAALPAIFSAFWDGTEASLDRVAATSFALADSMIEASGR